MPAGFWKSLKMGMSGKMIARIDTPMGCFGTVAMRLKEEQSTGRQYVVVSKMPHAAGEEHVFELEEFLKIAGDLGAAMKAIKAEA
jgi:hypothetical protein